MRRITATAAVALISLPILAACGDDTPTADPTGPARPWVRAPVTDEATADAPDDPILRALEALSPDVFEDGENCLDPDSPPQVNDLSDTRAVSAGVWFGGPQADTGGVAPQRVLEATMCMPPGEAGTIVRLESYILQFAAPEEASTWVEELTTATSGGQVVHEEAPTPCTEDRPDVAVATAESTGGPDALDVMVANAECDANKIYPDQLNWEPVTFTFAPAGDVVVGVSVMERGPSITASNDQQTVTGVDQNRLVDRDRLRAAVEVLTEELGKG